MPKALTGKSDVEKQQLREAALLMRFRTNTPNNDSKKYLAYRVIAKALSLSIYQV